MSTVDLLSGRQSAGNRGGIITFRDGVKFYSLLVGQDDDGEIIVRIESGVYRGYTRDGRPCRLVDGHWHPYEDIDPHGTDIVEFICCGRDAPRASGLPTETTP